MLMSECVGKRTGRYLILIPVAVGGKGGGGEYIGGGGVRIRQLKKNTAAVAVAWGKEQQGTAGSWPYHAKIYIERTQQSVNDVTMEMCRL